MNRNNWERRYRTNDYVPRTNASDLLQDVVQWLPDGPVMEIAAGTGRNAIYLAKKGYSVDAIELSTSAIETGKKKAAEESVEINWIERDVNEHEFPLEYYGVIIVTYYHNPKIIPEIISALRPGGFLIYEHHVETAQNVDRGPSNEYRYKPGELPEKCRDLNQYFYEETLREYTSGDRKGQTAAVGSIVAEKPEDYPPKHPPSVR